MGYFWGNLGVNLKIEIEKKESGCRVPDVRYKVSGTRHLEYGIQYLVTASPPVPCLLG
jgi:hypothetical protein